MYDCGYVWPIALLDALDVRLVYSMFSLARPLVSYVVALYQLLSL